MTSASGRGRMGIMVGVHFPTINAVYRAIFSNSAEVSRTEIFRWDSTAPRTSLHVD